MPADLSPRDLAARFLKVEGADALARACRMVAEASASGTDGDAALCAELMNDLIPMLSTGQRGDDTPPGDATG